MTRGPGEGRAGLAGRDEPRRDWQGQNARSASQLLSSPVWIGLDLGTRAFDLLTVGLGDLGGAYLEQQEEETEGFVVNFSNEDGQTAATLPRLHGSSPKRNMGLKILVLSGWVRW